LIPTGTGILLFCSVQVGRGAHTASYLDRFRGLVHRESDHSLLSSIEVNNAWSRTSSACP